MLIAILGPTASGKTHLAVRLAASYNAHILSADSRQLYKRMDIGTGKDLNEYCINGKNIPYHLIDILEPGTACTLFDYQKLFYEIYDKLYTEQEQMILCGGSGMYAEAILRNYHLAEVPPNPQLRTQWETYSDEQLTTLLAAQHPLHNTTDTSSRKRLIRALEIATATPQAPTTNYHEPIPSIIFAIHLPQALRWQRIENRLRTRLQNGLIEEIQALLTEGIAPEQLIYYGLEYKFVTLYLQGKIETQTELFRQLNIAIRQFAKRQMTYLRGMERRGLTLHWIDGQKTTDELLADIHETLATLHH